MSLPVGAPGVGVPGLDPTPEQLDSITTLSAALAFPGIGEGLRKALYEMLGTPTVVRDLAFIPRTTWDKVISEVKLDGIYLYICTPVPQEVLISFVVRI